MLEDPIEILQKIFAELALRKDIQDELLQLVEALHKDLESSRNTNNNLQQQILGLIRQESFGLTSKYSALKDEHASLKQQLEVVKNENEDLSTQLIVKNEELKKVALEKEQEIHHHYKNLIGQKEEELKQKENELQKVKQSQEQRLQELHAQMEAAGAFAAIQLDQVEASHKKQLGELNKKFKQSMDTCGILRSELFNAKEQCNEYKSKMLELQQRLRHPSSVEASPFRGQDKSWSNKSNDSIASLEKGGVKVKSWNSRLNDSSIVGKSNTSLYGKYEPLQVTHINNPSSDNSLLVSTRPPTYRSSPKFAQSTPKNFKNNVPPLMKVSEERNGKDKQPVKKRKLYNPEDWSYLSLDQGSHSQ